MPMYTATANLRSRVRCQAYRHFTDQISAYSSGKALSFDY
jgi:hypothetical protein